MTDSEREAVINALIDADHELASYGDLADAAIAALDAQRAEQVCTLVRDGDGFTNCCRDIDADMLDVRCPDCGKRVEVK